mmetsp:Transcript_127444/g.318199  ORF Transcript_127444/g.318199 Transcript_127444/m.318199 type:complete len:217 (+) Transcript_127444:381-1031(+)
MLHQATAEDDDARLAGLDRLVIHGPYIGDEVQNKAFALVAVEIEHVADGPVGDGGAEDRDVVFVSPIAHGLLVVDLLPEPVDHAGGRPAHAVAVLLVVHLIEDGADPILEKAVVVVRRQQVADAVDAAPPQPEALERKVAEVCRRQTLDEVLLDAASCGDHDLHHAVLSKESDCLAEPGADEVGGVRQPNLGPHTLSLLGVSELLLLVGGDRLVGE